MSKSSWSLARFETARYRRGGEMISRLVIAVRWKAPGEPRRRRHRFSTGQADSASLRKVWRPKLRQIAGEIEKGEFDPHRWFEHTLRPVVVRTKEGTLRSYIERWLEELPGAGVGKSTRQQYGYIMAAHLFNDELAAERLTAVTDGDIKRFQARLQGKPNQRGGNLSAVTVNKIMRRMRTVFALAYQRGDIPRNPMVLVPTLPQPGRDVDPFTPDELLRLFDAATSQRLNLYILLALTGLRPSEALGLPWQNIDFKARVIKVRQQITARGEILQHLKTPKSRRDVEMFEPARVALVRQAETNRLRGDLVFANKLGRPLNEETEGIDPWRKALRRAGVPFRTLYTLRHTYTSLMLSAGKPIQWIAHQLGHVGVQKIDDTYGRWVRTPADQRLDLDAWFRRIGQPVSQRLADLKSESGENGR